MPISYYLQVETLEKANESFTVKLEMEKTAKRDARQTIEDLNNEISRVSKELKKTQNGNFLVGIILSVLLHIIYCNASPSLAPNFNLL